MTKRQIQRNNWISTIYYLDTKEKIMLDDDGKIITKLKPCLQPNQSNSPLSLQSNSASPLAEPVSQLVEQTPLLSSDHSQNPSQLQHSAVHPPQLEVSSPQSSSILSQNNGTHNHPLPFTYQEPNYANEEIQLSQNDQFFINDDIDDTDNEINLSDEDIFDQINSLF